ncbi:uncharacterized protein LOC135683069 [Rhopilema esculentum]|uniref:uncharacterized protein LOC135683069 n=1 Tax=Rhopilema esculentum TaxID=499914 RepID=UPI0031DA6AEA
MKQQKSLLKSQRTSYLEKKMPVVIEEIASLACPSAQIEDDTANQIFAIILQDWMFNYGSLYVREDYNLLYGRIDSIISKQLPLHFFLPGFPVKSPNANEKVLGVLPDFSELLAIRRLQTTARKLQAIYQAGVKITILSDYHTFDQYIAVDEQEYFAYHRGIKKMIQEAGADDVIELISLSTFPEFKGIPTKEISTFLCKNFGGDDFLSQFDENILNDQSLLEKYRQLRKFMMTDLKSNLPGSPSSKASKRYIKEVARGMMAQGVALDTFLKKQCMISNYIRLSIHHHDPQSGKFAIDLFKEHASSNGVLRTPWHHVTVFDSAQGRFIINNKIEVEKEVVDGSILVKAKYDDKDWLYVRLYMENDFFGLFNDKTDSPPLEMSLYRSRCGLCW